MDKDLAVFGFYVIDERNRLIEVRLFGDRYEYYTLTSKSRVAQQLLFF